LTKAQASAPVQTEYHQYCSFSRRHADSHWRATWTADHLIPTECFSRILVARPQPIARPEVASTRRVHFSKAWAPTAAHVLLPPAQRRHVRFSRPCRAAILANPSLDSDFPNCRWFQLQPRYRCLHACRKVRCLWLVGTRGLIRSPSRCPKTRTIEWSA